MHGMNEKHTGTLIEDLISLVERAECDVRYEEREFELLEMPVAYLAQHSYSEELAVG